MRRFTFFHARYWLLLLLLLLEINIFIIIIRNKMLHLQTYPINKYIFYNSTCQQYHQNVNLLFVKWFSNRIDNRMWTLKYFIPVFSSVLFIKLS